MTTSSIGSGSGNTIYSKSFDNQWTNDNEKQLSEWYIECQIRSQLHERMANRTSKYATYLGIIMIVMTYSIAFLQALQIDFNSRNLNIVLFIFTSVSSMIASIKEFGGFTKKTGGYNTSSLKYQEIAKSIDFVSHEYRYKREKALTFLSSIKDKMIKLAYDSYKISEKVAEKFKKEITEKYNGQFEMPNILGGIYKLEFPKGNFKPKKKRRVSIDIAELGSITENPNILIVTDNSSME